MNYDEATELIKKTEAYDTTQRSIKIDLMDLNEKIPLKEFNYKEVDSALNFVEKMEAKQQQEAGGAASATQAQQPQQPVQTTKANVQRQAQAPATKGTLKPRIMKDLKAAASEFEDAVSHLENRIESVEEKREISKLVLPNLSLNDQLSELEKISFGLDGDVFDQKQLAIIKKEVAGLAKVAGKHKPAPGFDLEVVEMRDKRLKEVLSKLRLN